MAMNCCYYNTNHCKGNEGNNTMIKITSTYAPLRRLQFLAQEDTTIQELAQVLQSKGKVSYVHISRMPPTAQEINRAKEKGLVIEGGKLIPRKDRWSPKDWELLTAWDKALQENLRMETIK